MKLSISLPEKDVAYIDRHLADHDEPSRSAVIRKAIERLRDEELREAYGELCKEWGTEDDLLWETTVGDGLEDEEWPYAPRIRPAS